MTKTSPTHEPLTIQESSINVVAAGTRIEGKIEFEQITRVHGTLIGQVDARTGSTLILSETSVVEGDIEGDVIMVNGFVKGNIFGKTKVVVSGTGRVVGNIKTPTLKLEFGAFFEGKSEMEDLGN